MTTKLIAGAFTPSVLLAVARRTGRLEEHDLVVQEQPVSSSPAQFRSLVSGDLDVAFTSPDNVLAYRFSSSNPLGTALDVSIVSTVDRGMGLALYGRPGLTSADELRHGLLGVDVPASGFALAMYAVAESLGLDRTDYELTSLGATPGRAKALVAGTCDGTMLNAGNELVAEEAGCVRLRSVAEVCAPYIGTVLSVAGTRTLEPATRLATALRAAAEDICSGVADQHVLEAARGLLGLSDALAVRYLERMRNPFEGLVLSDEVDVDGLATIVGLRSRYMPWTTEGPGVYERALDPASGLVLHSSS